MKYSPITLALALLLPLASTLFAERPNVVFILSDDQAWTDYGFMGHPEIETPRLDALAQEGLLFPRGYVVSPLCRPSLASMASGLYLHQHGITANDVDRDRRAEREIDNRPIYDTFNQRPSLINAFVDAGYLALQTGKWWEGSWSDAGFTHGMTHGDATKGGRHGDVGLKIGREGMDTIADFLDEAVADEKPFFVWYAPFLPHDPHNPPERLASKYTRRGRGDDAARYYAMCEWFDETCGELIDMLNTRQLRENTLVVYVCDNGWSPVSQYKEPVPYPWTQAYAPKSKGSPYEGGVRTPIFFNLPGKIKAETSPHLASSIDLFPTIAKFCGVDFPDELPGIDLLDEAAARSRKAVYGSVYSTHNMNFGHAAETLQYRYVITPTWKLIDRAQGIDTDATFQILHNWDTAPTRLFAIQLDPHEREDLSHFYPEQTKRLQTLLDEWLPAEQ